MIASHSISFTTWCLSVRQNCGIISIKTSINKIFCTSFKNGLLIIMLVKCVVKLIGSFFSNINLLIVNHHKSFKLLIWYFLNILYNYYFLQAFLYLIKVVFLQRPWLINLCYLVFSFLFLTSFFKLNIYQSLKFKIYFF